jgi:hypothetical protein
MKLLVTNTANVICLLLYWFIAGLLYFWSFASASEKYGVSINNILLFVIACKGYSAYLVLLLVDNSSFKISEEATVNANHALREEVLHYATAGIRSTCCSSLQLDDDERVEIVRKLQIHDEDEDFKKLVTPFFFIRFILGFYYHFYYYYY